MKSDESKNEKGINYARDILKVLHHSQNATEEKQKSFFMPFFIIKVHDIDLRFIDSLDFPTGFSWVFLASCCTVIGGFQATQGMLYHYQPRSWIISDKY